VLLAVDRDGTQLFAGEPAVLVEHRPGAASDQLTIEVAERVPVAGHALVSLASVRLVELLDGAYDDEGSLRRERFLGVPVEIRGAHDAFGP